LFAFVVEASNPIGVNQPSIVWQNQPPPQQTINDIALAGAKSLRMMLVSPFPRSVEIMAEMKTKGIGTLLMVPLTLDEYYPPNIAKRKGQPPHVYTLPPLSQIDIAKVEVVWTNTLRRLSAAGITLHGVQIENEFNSGIFNGDLPLLSDGVVVNASNYRQFDFWPQYEAGMRKLVEVIRIIRTSLAATDLYKDVPVVLGGLARPSEIWSQHIGNILVEPDFALRTLLNLGIDQLVDAYAIHLYPQVPVQHWSYPQEIIAEYVNRRMDQVVSVSGWSKPWWITEWGFALRKDIKLNRYSPDPRLPLFYAFNNFIRNSRYSKLFGPTYIYVWDENPNFRIWDGKRVLGISVFFENLIKHQSSP
jgi:hypothetical protein